MDRSKLLLAVARAASDYAAGTDDFTAQRALGGKRFEVRLRFGCDGPGAGTGDHGWSIDPDGRTLRLRATAPLVLKDELVRKVADEKVEAAEGFWFLRPWLLDAGCPPGQQVGEATPDLSDAVAVDAKVGRSKKHGTDDKSPSPEAQRAPAQRIGLAQFFTADDSRAGRRIDRPFEAVRKLKEGEGVGNQGFNLVLAGRLRASGDGRVILCADEGRDRAPDCIISADFDRVWIERPDDKAIMAEWSI
jgi:hypothetical protein